MDKKTKKVAVMACSGIGKTLGALAREMTTRSWNESDRVRP